MGLLPLLLSVSAQDYCGPCKLMHAQLDKLQTAFKKIKFMKYVEWARIPRVPQAIEGLRLLQPQRLGHAWHWTCLVGLYLDIALTFVPRSGTTVAWKGMSHWRLASASGRCPRLGFITQASWGCCAACLVCAPCVSPGPSSACQVFVLSHFAFPCAGKFLEEVTGARPVQLRQMLVHYYR